MKKFKKILFSIALLSSALFADQGAQGGTDGYMWTDSDSPDPVAAFDWIDAKDGTAVTIFQGLNDNYNGPFNIGFNFSFYGSTYSQVYISDNGFITFSDPGGSFPFNLTLPNASAPDDMLAVFWDDLQNDSPAYGGVFYKTIGTAPNRKFIVHWYLNNYQGPPNPGQIEFEVILYETTNLVKYQYGQIAAGYNNGNTATVGMQNISTDGIQYSFNTSSIQPYSAILWHNEGSSAADATISPNSADINTLQQFTYTIDNIVSTASTLGKVDTISIDVPVATSALAPLCSE